MRETTDMTKGGCLGIVFRFAIPLLIGNLFQQVYSLVDTMVAGQYLGSQAIAAIGATGVLYSLLMNITWGLNSGYCMILSRSFGAGNMGEFRRNTAAMVVLNLAIALILMVLSILFLRPLMRALNTPDSIFQQAYLYIFIILAGMVTTVAYNACSGFLRAIGNSRIPLYFLIFSSVLNLLLDILFVVYLHWGIAGAAIATDFSEAVSAVLCIFYIQKHYRNYLPMQADWFPSAAIFAELFSTGISMALMQAAFCLGSVILQRAINSLGTDIITAHTASRRLYELLMIPLSTFATANSTFVGQNYGARKLARIREANRKMLGVELGLSLFAAGFVWAVGRPLIIWLTASQEETIVSNALLNLKLSTGSFFPLGVLFVYRYAMQAMGHKILPVLSSCMELGIKVLSAACLVPALGYLGVALTEPVIWCICAGFLTVFYLTIGHQKEKENRNDRT